MFRYKPGINVSYERQGVIYFRSLLYSELGAAEREEIRGLCRKAGGEHWKALLEFVTTEEGADRVCERNYLSRRTLYRAVGRYYELADGRWIS